ncbi:MAG: flagellar hook-basal body protein [Verrucomicrobiota bacterium]
MDVSLYQAAAAMNASARWQEVISENLSASQIPGFKKQELSFSAVQARIAGTSSANARRFTMPLAVATTNLQAGELRPTGVPTDLAIEGSGVFEVQMPGGGRGYTRDGGFRVNTQGELVTKQGMPVMGDAGPLQLDTSNSGPISVAPTGEVSQGAVLKGRLKLSDFSNPDALVSTGTGLFTAADPAVPPPPASGAMVRQGFIENANTSSVGEMVNLISAMRLFQANQKIIQTEDDRLGRLITDVGNPLV